MIICRRASLEDAVLFRQIRLNALKDSPEAFGSTYALEIGRTMESWQEQLELAITGKLRNIQFAFYDDNPIGIAALYREKEVMSGDVIMMWVDEKFRGSEVASLLVSSLIGWARELSFQSVHLSVTRSNKCAIRFYEKCGFELTGEEVAADSCRGSSTIGSVP